MGPEVIGANLRRLREQRAWTQEALADAAGISRVAYRNIETQKSMPRADTLHALAAALKVGLDALVAPVPRLAHVRFRSQKRLNSREQILADTARRLEDFNALEQLLEKPRTRPIVPRGVRRDDVLGMARAMRKAFGLSDREPVRNICGLLEAHGYKVLLQSVPTEGFFGLSISEEDGGPAILVNDWERISVERRIFTAAHELGHLLLHLQAYDVGETAEEEQQEREANLFASQFLLPNEVFSDEWHGTYGLPFVKRVLKVKRMFRVSYKTVLQRLKEQDEGAANLYGRFQGEYARMYGRTLKKTDEPESVSAREFLAPEPLSAGEPERLSPVDFEEDRLSALVREAVEKEVITLSRAAEILQKSLVEMRELSASWA